jgi:NADH:ubiquinone oxidoreductase subunit 4 (subunit M)
MAGRVLFGPLKEPDHGFDASTGLTQDLTRREIAILVPLAAACLFLGVYPKSATDVMEPSLQKNVLAHVESASTGKMLAESERTTPREAAQ